jgi:host cell factor
MVATDDGAGGDDKVEDSCNGNEATTAAALVSQMGAGDAMQVDGDGNFVLPQVDGPIDDLLLEDEEKMDVDEEPASENPTESADTESAVATEQNNASENIQAEESTVKEEVATKNEDATTADLPESSARTISQTKKDDDVDNSPVSGEVPMETNTDDPKLPSKKEKDPESVVNDVKVIKSELPLVQSSMEALSKQKPLEDVANPVLEIDEAQQNKNSQVKKNESFSEDEKPLTSENIFTEDTDAPHPPKDDSQKVEKIKEEITDLNTDLPTTSSPVKSKDADEAMITDNSTSIPDDARAPIVTSNSNVQIKLESDDVGPMEEDKLPELPISSINGVAASLEKEMEKVHAPTKMEMKDDLAVPKRDNLKQEKINDTRSETGDDSTALTTLATAALGSAEPAMKVKNEQVDFIIFNFFVSFTLIF